MDARSRKLYFYHHRVRDGLIYREEQIGNKTFEFYKGREDRLIYRSVTFDANKQKEPQDLFLKENHLQEDVVIKKMTQKFELNPGTPAESQIKKTEFNLEKKRVYIYYHYKDGKITANYQEFSRDDLIGQSKMSDMNEKESEETQLQQTQKKIYQMECECLQQIKDYERVAQSESSQHTDLEKTIHTQRSTPQPEDLFSKILKKSVQMQARDKMKQEQKKTEENADKKAENDFLEPILKKLNLQNQTTLEEEAAIAVKNEALRSLKERLLTRAEIIQRRLEQEQESLAQKFQDFKRRGENYGQQEQNEYTKQVSRANFKIDILTERAAQHYRNSLEKFAELDMKLQNDPRLRILSQKK